METGRTVILLNLENLYESLYDVLNQVNDILCISNCFIYTVCTTQQQYYTKLRENRYVDLGLQSHRIKCRVDDKFKYVYICIFFNMYFTVM